MSQFFGCIALHAQINVADVAAQMTTSLDFFQPDAEFRRLAILRQTMLRDQNLA